MTGKESGIDAEDNTNRSCELDERIEKGDVGEYIIAGCRPVSLLRGAITHCTADSAFRDPLISVCIRNIYIIRHDRRSVKWIREGERSKAQKKKTTEQGR